jgi:hypothetical protein
MNLLEKVVVAGDRAVRDYATMAGGDWSNWMPPEHWIQCEVARALQATRRYLVYLEHSVRDLHSWSNTPDVPLEGARQTGKFDVVVYDWHPDADYAKPAALIEWKCGLHRDGARMNKDAERILAVARRFDTPVCGIVAGLAAYQDRDDLIGKTQQHLTKIAGKSIDVCTSPPLVNADGYEAFIVAAQIC